MNAQRLAEAKAVVMADAHRNRHPRVSDPRTVNQASTICKGCGGPPFDWWHAKYCVGGKEVIETTTDLENLLYAIENAERLEPVRIDGKLYEVVRTVDFECARIYAKKVRASLSDGKESL